MSDLLICICKSDQLPFGPRTSKKLKTNGQIFVDETHRHHDNRPLRGRADKRELALWRLTAVTIDLRWKCPDWKDQGVHSSGVHGRAERVAIHLLVLPALDGGGIFFRRFGDGSDLSDASDMQRVHGFAAGCIAQLSHCSNGELRPFVGKETFPIGLAPGRCLRWTRKSFETVQ